MGPYIMSSPEAIKGNPFSEMTKTGTFFSISSVKWLNSGLETQMIEVKERGEQVICFMGVMTDYDTEL
jgi:hypothetical protein